MTAIQIEIFVVVVAALLGLMARSAWRWSEVPKHFRGHASRSGFAAAPTAAIAMTLCAVGFLPVCFVEDGAEGPLWAQIICVLVLTPALGLMFFSRRVAWRRRPAWLVPPALRGDRDTPGDVRPTDGG